MQGRITKVLNMKPIETLGMIEEAAGTRMFEMKKQQAIKTIEKKEAKRAEIQQVTYRHVAVPRQRHLAVAMHPSDASSENRAKAASVELD